MEERVLVRTLYFDFDTGEDAIQTSFFAWIYNDGLVVKIKVNFVVQTLIPVGVVDKLQNFVEVLDVSVP